MGRAQQQVTNPFNRLFPTGRSSSLRLIVTLDDGLRREQEIERIVERWKRGDRTHFFRVLDACRAEIAMKNPAIIDLVERIVAEIKPWRTKEARAVLIKVSDLSGVHLNTCDYVVRENGILHLWPEGDQGPRSLHNAEGITVCGKKISQTERAPRGDWKTYNETRCPDCDMGLRLHITSDDQRDTITRELNQGSLDLPFDQAVENMLAKAVHKKLKEKILSSPKMTERFIDSWAAKALVSEIPKLLIKQIMDLPDQRILLTRALGGRYDQNPDIRKTWPLNILHDMVTNPLPGPGKNYRLLTRTDWSHIVPRAKDGDDPLFPERYANNIIHLLTHNKVYVAHGMVRGYRLPKSLQR